ncbi:hypothetical protein HUF15_30440 [Streptomyces samsunensis]|uniref:Adenylate kinase n=1 Tax=Streptomyces malaysiensis TaxID=92644 RepID=A0ABX6WGG6_STRMQ|nr:MULTISPECIES: hypothetical protein [Streptomyces]MCQ6247319.1 hypothetical protein [Streptomyces malaysiensis]NUH41004.1 hypothetical protein [Streptomyces samsunensis]QPI59750.1 hypothetical protein I1A49_37015 [Streptomyces solisilvae]UHH21421.1 hypothetical protein LUV23_37150 [Streptomyces sp. HNM0561]
MSARMGYWVVGTPAAGKSTLARRLAAALDLRHVELDDAFWAAGWVPADADAFLGAVGALIDEPGWIVDGQYGGAVEAYAARAHAVIWVDTPLWVSLPRLVRRTVVRAWRREPMWSAGNVETWWHAIGPDSIIWYAISVHHEQRRENEKLFRRLAPLGVRLIRVRHPDVDALVRELRPAAP